MEDQGDSSNGWHGYFSREDPPALTHPAFADAARIANATHTQYMQHAARWQAQQTQMQGQNQQQPIPWQGSYAQQERNSPLLQGPYGHRQPVPDGATTRHLSGQSNTEASNQQYVRLLDIGPSNSYYSPNFSRRTDTPFTTSLQSQAATPQASGPTTSQKNPQSPFERYSQQSPLSSSSQPSRSSSNYAGPTRNLTTPQPTQLTISANRPNGPSDKQRDQQHEYATTLDRPRPLAESLPIQNNRGFFLRDEMHPVTSPQRDHYTSAGLRTLEPDPTKKPQVNARVAIDQPISRTPQGMQQAPAPTVSRVTHESTNTAKHSWDPKISANRNDAAIRKASTFAASPSPANSRIAPTAAHDGFSTDRPRVLPSKEPPSRGNVPSPKPTTQPIEPSHPKQTAPEAAKVFKVTPDIPSPRPDRDRGAHNQTLVPANSITAQSFRSVSEPSQAHGNTAPCPKTTKTSIDLTSPSPPKDISARDSTNVHSISKSGSSACVHMTQASLVPQNRLLFRSSASLQASNPPGPVSQRPPDAQPSTTHQHTKQYHFVTSGDTIIPSAYQHQPPAERTLSEAVPPPNKARKLGDGCKKVSISNDYDGIVPPKRRNRYKTFQIKLRQRHDLDLVKRLDPSEADSKDEYNPTTIARDILIAAAKHPSEKELNHHLFVLIKNLSTVYASADLDTIRWDLIDPAASRDASHSSPHPPHRPHVLPPRPFVQSINATGSSFPRVPGPQYSPFPPQPLSLPTFTRGHHSHNNTPQTDAPAQVAQIPPPPPLLTSTPALPTPASSDPIPPPERSEFKSKSESLASAAIARPPFQPQEVIPLPSPKKPSSSQNRESVKPQVVIHSPRKMPPVKRRAGRPRKIEKTSNIEVAIPRSGNGTTQFPVFTCQWIGCPSELHNLPAFRKHILNVHIDHSTTCQWTGCTNNTHMARNAMWQHMQKEHIDEVAWALGDGPTVPSPAEDERPALSTFDLFHHYTPAGTVVLPADSKVVDAFSRSHGISNSKEKAELFKKGGRHWKEASGPDLDLNDRPLATCERQPPGRILETARTLPETQM